MDAKIEQLVQLRGLHTIAEEYARDLVRQTTEQQDFVRDIARLIGEYETELLDRAIAAES